MLLLLLLINVVSTIAVVIAVWVRSGGIFVVHIVEFVCRMVLVRLLVNWVLLVLLISVLLLLLSHDSIVGLLLLLQRCLGYVRLARAVVARSGIGDRRNGRCTES